MGKYLEECALKASLMRQGAWSPHFIQASKRLKSHSGPAFRTLIKFSTHRFASYGFGPCVTQLWRISESDGSVAAVKRRTSVLHVGSSTQEDSNDENY